MGGFGPLLGSAKRRVASAASASMLSVGSALLLSAGENGPLEL